MSEEIKNISNTFSKWDRPYTIKEVTDYINSYVPSEIIEKELLKNKRILHFPIDSPLCYVFIPQKALFKHFLYLNIKLARTKIFKIEETELLKLLGYFCGGKKLSIPPKEILDWAKQHRLINPYYEHKKYSFPLALALSYLSNTELDFVSNSSQVLAETVFLKRSFNKVIDGYFKILFNHFDPKTVIVIQNRYGFTDGTGKTLEQIAKYFRLTRERIRQIESKFLRKVSRYKNIKGSFCLVFIYTYIKSFGSLIIDKDNSNNKLMFLAKVLGIPCFKLTKTRLSLLAQPTKYLPSKTKKWSIDNIKKEFIINQLIINDHIAINEKDSDIVANIILNIRIRALNKYQRVYIALKSIGKPAHYSEISGVYNSLFPDRIISEHNLHAGLVYSKYGIVWVGVRGTYALKEWGYERPKKPLYDTVASIVKEHYKKTGKPVSYTIVKSEIGKYRDFINPSSLNIAAHTNPRLQTVSGNFFIPKRRQRKIIKDAESEKLDKILRKFQEKNI